MKFLNAKTLLASFLFGIALGSPASAAWWDAIEKNNEGVQALKDELALDAHDKFVAALSEDPFLSEIHINLGNTFEANEENQKALSEYLLAAKLARSPELKFYGLFNSARMFGTIPDYAKALAFYQQALELKPDSIEVKTNIELLMQQQQQQKGKGQGEGNKKPDDNEDQDEDQERKGPVVNRREQKPKPFDSKKLTKKDVEKILDELKSQEQKVRKKQNQKSAKENARDKDW